jgi:hypothetical protein
LVNKTNFFIFLLSGLFIFSSFTVLATPNDIYTSDGDDSYRFSANADISLFIEGLYLVPKHDYDNPLYWKMPWFMLWDLIKGAGKSPELYRIHLKAPGGDVAYEIKGESNWGHTQRDGREYWYIILEDTNLRVPAFAAPGTWLVEILWYKDAWGPLDNRFATITYAFSVGESSIWQHLMAPIYITITMGDLLATEHWSFALPCVFLLSALVWIPMVMIALMFYTRISVGAGKYFIKKGYGGKKNDKEKK